mgnify:CR=1 FL=1
MISVRLQSEFQGDWKVEVGCWLKAASDTAFLSAFENRPVRARNEVLATEEPAPNDSAHRIPVQELALAMVTYHLCWSVMLSTHSETTPSAPAFVGESLSRQPLSDRGN